MKRLILFITIFMLSFWAIGGTWRLPINVSEGGDHNCITPRMVVDKWGNVHVVWEEYLTEANNDIFYRKYTAEGWSEKINISNNKWPSREPSLAVDEKGNVYIVWLDTFNTSGFHFSVAFREIKSTGEMSAIKEAMPWPGKNFRLPWVASSPNGDLSIVAYTENYKVYGVNRDNGKWGSPIQIQRKTARFAGESAYVAWGDDGQFHAVWPEYNPSTDNAMTVYYTHRKVGEGWAVPDVVNATGDAQGHPRVVVEKDGTIHIVWMDEEGSSFEIVYEKWDPVKKKWEMPEIVSQERGLSNLPTITVTREREVYVAWAVGAWGNLKNAYYSYKDKNGDWHKVLDFLSTPIINPYFTDIKSGGANDNLFFVYAQSVKEDNKKEVFLLTMKPIEVSAMLYPPENVNVTKVTTDRLNPLWEDYFNMIIWTANKKNADNKIEIAKYIVYRKEDNSISVFKKIGEVDANVFSFVDSNFEKDKKYVYGVSVVDKEGNESNIASSK